MAVVSRLPRAEFGRNDHREDAPRFIEKKINLMKNYCFLSTLFSKTLIIHYRGSALNAASLDKLQL